MISSLKAWERAFPHSNTLPSHFRFPAIFVDESWSTWCLVFHMWHKPLICSLIQSKFDFWIEAYTILHYLFQEQIIETSNEIKFAIMNSLIHSWRKRLTGFDCNFLLFYAFANIAFYTMYAVQFLAGTVWAGACEVLVLTTQCTIIMGCRQSYVLLFWIRIKQKSSGV